MVTQLLKHERIETTLPRCKELRKMADQVITLGKQARRYHLNGWSAVLCSFANTNVEPA